MADAPIPLGQCALNCLERHDYAVSDEPAIEEWLIRRGAPVREAARLKHTIWGWRNHSPLLRILKRVATLTGLSLDELTSPTPLAWRSDTPDEDTGGCAWLAKTLSSWVDLNCYIASVPTAQYQGWRLQADTCHAPDQQVKFGIECAKGIRIVAATKLMCTYHGLREHDRLGGQTMYDMIARSISWTSSVPEHGPVLAQRLHKAVFTGICSNALRAERPPFRRYPAVDPTGDAPEVKSLKVGADQLPAPQGVVSWLVSYHWGPALDQKVLNDLLRE